ncbi:MAG: ABC transporter permease [Desulfobacca sp.]|uniref:ABC transporter permease n=1 Tax=Desulfobacca sp. TaxID=2067990 RepID=UPI00404A7629
MKLWLLRLPFRHLQEHPGRSLLGILSIALGTAVYLSIALASHSALQSFQAGVTAVAGHTQLRLQSFGAALDETLLPAVRQLPLVRAAAPVLETMVEMRGRENLSALLLGVDPFVEGPFREYRFLTATSLDQESFLKFLTQPGRVMLSAPLAARLQLAPGDTFTAAVGARLQSLTVAGIFRTAGDLYPLDGALMLMDVGQAQELLDRIGRLDRLDLLVYGDPDAAARQLQEMLPPGVEVTTPGAQAASLHGLVAAYRLNLAVLSAIALFVGMFLIYQSVTLSVVRRRREIGLLRTLGMTRSQIMLLFLSEGALSGALGGFLGLLLGGALAHLALQMVAQNLTSLYQPVSAQEIWLEGQVFVQAWLLALAATLAASYLPAREASRTRLRAVWYQEELEEKLTGWAASSAYLGLLVLALAGIGAFLKNDHGIPWPAFVAAFLILLGFALFTPLTAWWLGRLLAAPGRRLLGFAGDMGCRYLSGSLSRTAVSIAALATALGLVIAVGAMIGSFRQTVENWVQKSISGDIFFGPAVFSTSSYDQFLPPEVLQELEQDHRIADLYHYRCVRLPFRDRYILVIGGSFEVLARHGGLWFRQGEPQQTMTQARAHGQVLVTEPFAHTFGVKEGEWLTLPTPSGPQRLQVAGVFYDYRTDGAAVWMDIQLFQKLWQDQQINAVRLFLHDKSQLPDVLRHLQLTYQSRYRLVAFSHADLKNGILRIFDETFALTYALEGVAILVAVFGIITTFLVLIMERERELALLQALGASRSQIMGMVLVEAGLASLLSFLLGALAGTVLALLLITVINKQAFGWTIQVFLAPDVYWQTLLLVLLLGLLAGAYPAWRAMQPHLAAILKEE